MAGSLGLRFWGLGLGVQGAVSFLKLVLFNVLFKAELRFLE